jgi:hypothetical protein
LIQIMHAIDDDAATIPSFDDRVDQPYAFAHAHDSIYGFRYDSLPLELRCSNFCRSSVRKPVCKGSAQLK